MSDQSTLPPSPETVTDELRYKGVRGWLLLFCLGLTVFNPVSTIVSLVAGYMDSSRYFSLYPGLFTIAAVDTVLSVALMAFSIYAGAGLWRIRQGAVQTARIYLLCFLGYHAIAAFLPFMAGLPPTTNETVIAEVVRNILRALMYFTVWYTYLNRSERVRATYPS